MINTFANAAFVFLPVLIGFSAASGSVGIRISEPRSG